MDLIIGKGVTLYDVKFIYEDGKIWIYHNNVDLLITGVDASKYCIKEIGYKLFELKEVK